jgi:hypothetical protein
MAKTAKITVEKQNNRYVVVKRINHPEAIIERELNLISAGFYDHLLPVHREHVKKGVNLTCSIDGMITLKTFFAAITNKKMFLNIVSQLVQMVKQCEHDLMNATNLMLDMDFIFLDPMTKKVKCIFWPIVNNQHAKNIEEFFKDIPYHVVFNKFEEHDYVTKYIRYFNSFIPFSIQGFEKLLFELMGKTVEKKSYIPSGSTDHEEKENSAEAKEEKKDSSNIAYNPFEHTNEEKTAICQNCGQMHEKGANFCTSCGSRLQESSSSDIKSEKTFSETTVLGTDDAGGTTVLGVEDYEEPTFPYLIREGTEEKVIVDKPSFRIGKEKKYCDYFISNNNAISRSHADILTKNDCYYIIDHNSTNKTYVDNRVIPIHKEIEIFSGTKIRLANEDFVFYV